MVACFRRWRGALGCRAGAVFGDGARVSIGDTFLRGLFQARLGIWVPLRRTDASNHLLLGIQHGG